jgi:hypothetical protein
MLHLQMKSVSEMSLKIMACMPSMIVLVDFY